MKITAIIGSNNKNSITKKIIESVFSQLHIIGDYKTEIVHLQEQNLEYCIGCENCFHTGTCALDNSDSMPTIRKKLFRSDCIVFASPVYANGCPSIMKTLIDRMSSEMHLMQYAGKLGFTLVTTSHSGYEEVQSCLEQMQFHLGIKHIGSYQFIRNTDNFSSFSERTSQYMHTSMCNNYGFGFVGADELFGGYQKLYTLNIPENLRRFEWHYWNQEEVKNCKSFQEYTLLMRSKTQKYALK